MTSRFKFYDIRTRPSDWRDGAAPGVEVTDGKRADAPQSGAPPSESYAVTRNDEEHNMHRTNQPKNAGNSRPARRTMSKLTLAILVATILLIVTAVLRGSSIVSVGGVVVLLIGLANAYVVSKRGVQRSEG